MGLHYLYIYKAERVSFRIQLHLPTPFVGVSCGKMRSLYLSAAFRLEGDSLWVFTRKAYLLLMMAKKKIPAGSMAVNKLSLNHP